MREGGEGGGEEGGQSRRLKTLPTTVVMELLHKRSFIQYTSCPKGHPGNIVHHSIGLFASKYRGLVSSFRSSERDLNRFGE